MATLQELQAAFMKASEVGDTEAMAELADMLGDASSQTEQTTNPNATVIKQGMSGVNEGIARTLGGPVDLVTAALNAGSSGIKGLTGLDMGQIRKPFLGSESIEGMMGGTGMVKPQVEDDPGLMAARRVGRGVGQAVATAPLAVNGVANVAGALTRLGATGLGSGVGGAVGGAVGGDTGEAVGNIAGGLGTGALVSAIDKALANRAARNLVPSSDALFKEGSDIRENAVANARSATPKQVGRMRMDIRTIASDEGLLLPDGSTSYPKINDVIKKVDAWGAEGGNVMSPQNMMSMRKTLQAAAQSNDGNESRVGTLMLKKFDEFMGGYSDDFAEANKVFTRAYKGELIDDAIKKANRDVLGGKVPSIDRALRNEFNAIYGQIESGKIKNFSEDEVAAIKAIAHGDGVVQNVARFFSRINGGSPMGAFANAGAIGTAAGAMSDVATGGAVGGSTYALGLGGRLVANALAQSQAANASAIMRNGGQLATDPEVQKIIENIAASLAAQNMSNLTRPRR